MKFVSGLVVGFALALVTGFSGAASAADHVPACQDDKVLSKLAKRFNKTERIYWQDRGLVLSEVTDAHFHSDHQLEDSVFERRYCHGTAHFENGKSRRVHYLIEQNAGFAGIGWNLEYCIHGLDPWKYYDGRCRVLSK